MISAASEIQDEEMIRKLESGTAATAAAKTENDSTGCCMSIMQKMIAEFIGTFAVVFAGCAAVVVNKMYGQVTFPGISITWGLIVMAMVYSVGHISGAHFNPAVTITFTILGRFPVKQLPLYLVSQVAGSLVASSALYLLLNPKPAHFFGTNPVGSAMQSFVFEILISFILMFVICGASTDSRSIKEHGGIAVGATVLLNVLIAGPISGASMNPARSIGPAIVMHNYKAIWAYIAGPIIGTLIGGYAYNLVRLTGKSSTKSKS